MILNNKVNHTLSYADDPHLREVAAHKIYGFWIYLMSDCVLFATLFTTYAVLSPSYLGMQPSHNIFDLHPVLIETFCLLTSTFTFGLAIHVMGQDKKGLLIFWLIVTFLLGSSFVTIEIHEFYHLILMGSGPTQSGYLSAFFSLVGTHGLHVSVGLLWILVMINQILRKGLTLSTQTRLILLSLFWHFLDIIWICIFTFVYLMGSL